jgi:GNAT superfamily N-acetyltransferase
MDELLARYDVQVRRYPQGGHVERDEHVVRVIADGWRAVVWSDLDAATADAIIAEEIERFSDLGSWEWKAFSYDTPSDLPDRLRAAGFTPDPAEAFLVGDLAELGLETPSPPGVELIPVEDEPGVDLLMQVTDDVYGHHDEGYKRWVLDEVSAGRTEAVVAIAGERAISGGRIEFQEGTEFAGLFGGATVPEWRRRGVFRAVLGYRARLAAARGYRYLYVDASDNSRPILERLGFVRLATTTPFIHD